MCIINNSKKFIFVHVPKSAGTSVTKFYSEFSTCRDVEIGGTAIGEKLQDYYLSRYGLSKHSTSIALRDAIGIDDYSLYFKFAFVRNPYARFVSIFSFLKAWDGWSGRDVLENIDDINDFVHVAKQSQGPDKIFLPQTHWLLDEHGETTMDYVGRVEALDASVNQINNALGLKVASKRMEVANSSETAKKNLRLDLSLASKEWVNEFYSSDFIQFGYKRV